MAEKEYIERDELESRIKKYVKCRDADRETLEWAKDECIRQAHCMPHADAVEVVRCKDCKYFIPDAELDHNEYPNIIEADGLCDCSLKFTDADDFCSHGERKEVTP